MKTSQTSSASPEKPCAFDLQRSFLCHLQSTLVKDRYSATRADLYPDLSYAVRDMPAVRRLDTFHPEKVSRHNRRDLQCL